VVETLSLYAMISPPLCSGAISGCPLHDVEVDAFLVHVPQRRQFAQLADLALQQLDRVVDFLFRREAADGEADRAVRQLVLRPSARST
jgi:hypothetical protein